MFGQAPRGQRRGALPPEIGRAVFEYTSGGIYLNEEPPFDWCWTHIPLDQLVRLVWTSSNSEAKNLRKSWPSFAAYHRSYMRRPDGVEWSKRNPDSVWPVILTESPDHPDSDIDDGWHRFHYYVDHWPARKPIPVVWAC